MEQHNPHPVVVAVGNDDIDSALELAVAEAVRLGCGLHLVHVLHVMSSGPEAMLLDFADAERIGHSTLQAAAERALDLLPEGVPLTTRLVKGPVVPSLVEEAADARMVVLQRRNLSRAMRVVTRSVSSGVAAHAHVPVVSVPTGWTAGANGPPVVTVGVDFPERCRVVLEAAAEEARGRGATLHVVHTWWFPSVYDDVIMRRTEKGSWARRVRGEIQAVLHQLGDAVVDVPLRVDALQGHAADTLIEASHHSELLVVGRHDPHVPFGSHLGPVARAVLRDAACPVLLANPRHHSRRRAGAADPSSVQHA